MLELTLRLVFSLAVVVGLLMLLAKFGSRRFRGGRDALVQVVHRQHLSRGSAVSVVTVGNRVLVLGTTEHQVRVLAELEPDEIAEHLGETLPDALPDADVLTLVPEETTRVAPAAGGSHRAPGRRRQVSSAGGSGPLTGSVLSPDTWKQALAAATRRAS